MPRQRAKLDTCTHLYCTVQYKLTSRLEASPCQVFVHHGRIVLCKVRNAWMRGLRQLMRGGHRTTQEEEVPTVSTCTCNANCTFLIWCEADAVSTVHATSVIYLAGPLPHPCHGPQKTSLHVLSTEQSDWGCILIVDSMEAATASVTMMAAPELQPTICCTGTANDLQTGCHRIDTMRAFCFSYREVPVHSISSP
jgi:hypothetical protein